ncbi:hypothetical protein PLESTM_001533700 [Pleodorina starrii]|nr:hypothetical protein PLESTM_001533700 [Pleodorina starrii]
MPRGHHAGTRLVRGGQPPLNVIAVANRDVEGAVVVDPVETRNYQPTASACRDNCQSTSGCSLWSWCGAVSGCTDGSGSPDPNKYMQCWLKSDIPPKSGFGGRIRFPRFKNDVGEPSATGWLSGTTFTDFTDAAPSPEITYGCFCNISYVAGNYSYNEKVYNYTFGPYCAPLWSPSPACKVDPSCSDMAGGDAAGCPEPQPCTVYLDTDLQEYSILVSGEGNTADSAEKCCNECASKRYCNGWSWCSDSAGCDGERYRFRQCWLKAIDPTNPQPKNGWGGSPGWISGVRMSWMKEPGTYQSKR